MTSAVETVPAPRHRPGVLSRGWAFVRRHTLTLFAFLAFASGAGILAYLGAWALLPAPGCPAPPRSRRISGTVMLVWAAILTLRGVGLADSILRDEDGPIGRALQTLLVRER